MILCVLKWFLYNKSHFHPTTRIPNSSLLLLLLCHKTVRWRYSRDFPGKAVKDTRNCPEKAMKISHSNPNQSAPSIYIMIELCYFSLDQWEIRIHLLWGKSFNIPLHCDPHLNQTKWLIFNELLPLTIPGVLGSKLTFISNSCRWLTTI